jgi:hypothetical protein
MTILAMKYLGLRIDRLALVTLKMANKQVVRLEGVINNVTIIIMRVSMIMDFHVVLEEDGLPNDIRYALVNKVTCKELLG